MLATNSKFLFFDEMYTGLADDVAAGNNENRFDKTIAIPASRYVKKFQIFIFI